PPRRPAVIAICSFYVFHLAYQRHHRQLHSFPTRRSSDLKRVTRRDRREREAGDEVLDVDLGELAHLIDHALGRPVLRRLEIGVRSEEHTSELQSRFDLVCRLLLEKKNVEARLLPSEVELL